MLAATNTIVGLNPVLFVLAVLAIIAVLIWIVRH